MYVAGRLFALLSVGDAANDFIKDTMPPLHMVDFHGLKHLPVADAVIKAIKRRAVVIQLALGSAQ